MLDITIDHALMRKFQNFSKKKVKLSNLVFLGVSWIYREYLFSGTPSGRLLLKLIYWNKSITIKRLNIIITKKWIPGTIPENKWEIPKKTSMRSLMRRKWDFRKVDITLSTIKRINIIITTNQYQEQPQKINERFPRRPLWRRSVISKKLISHFHMNVFPRVVSILSQKFFL